ncbi:MAG: hypothetical protein GY817_08470 [bacterium]|nr:hypothetical protein [bacterium]
MTCAPKFINLNLILLKKITTNYWASLFKSISLTICVVFLTVTMHNFAYANESLPALRNTNLTLPDLAGKIVEVFQGKGSQNIYLINDLHCDYTVQSNIAESLTAITAQHPQGLVNRCRRQ